jgi:acyl-coenzyme A thioesterase PaaI-like protein
MPGAFAPMSRTYLPTSLLCNVCGQPELNPRSLRVRWYVEDGFVKTEFASTTLQMGYKNIIHGGVISGLLDEALCWVAGVHCHQYFITGSLTVRFRKAVSVGSELSIFGRFNKFNGKYAECSGEVLTSDLGLCAEGSGKFFPIPAEQSLASHDYWVFQPGDLDILSCEKKASE